MIFIKVQIYPALGTKNNIVFINIFQISCSFIYSTACFVWHFYEWVCCSDLLALDLSKAAEAPNSVLAFLLFVCSFSVFASHPMIGRMDQFHKLDN